MKGLCRAILHRHLGYYLMLSSTSPLSCHSASCFPHWIISASACRSVSCLVSSLPAAVAMQPLGRAEPACLHVLALVLEHGIAQPSQEADYPDCGTHTTSVGAPSGFDDHRCVPDDRPSSRRPTAHGITRTIRHTTLPILVRPSQHDESRIK